MYRHYQCVPDLVCCPGSEALTRISVCLTQDKMNVFGAERTGTWSTEERGASWSGIAALVLRKPRVPT